MDKEGRPHFTLVDLPCLISHIATDVLNACRFKLALSVSLFCKIQPWETEISKKKLNKTMVLFLLFSRNAIVA